MKSAKAAPRGVEPSRNTGVFLPRARSVLRVLLKSLLLLWLLPAAAEEPKAPLNRLLFGGDVMLARHVYRQAELHKDPAWPFRKIATEFRAADLAFVNLESPFSEKPPYFEERMVFRAHPLMIEGLKIAGIDVVSTANNHVRDAGPRGIEFTLDWLAMNGIAAAGTAWKPEELNRGPVLESKGVRFGFLAYTYDQRNGNHQKDDARVAMMSLDGMVQDVRALRTRADAVLVSMHAGVEYRPQPTRDQMRFARAAIDAGASVVIGHHPHVVQPVERYKDGVIFYSLGNLIFDQEPAATKRGAVAEVVFSGASLTRFHLREVRRDP
ncbi:MAG: CapA family protein [Acidobacteria bacterium]|nr:CapA family protein [Acidobacteriota bacterium]